MPISGVMLTLAEDDADARAAIELMRDWDEVELGAHEDRRIAAVLETPDDAANRIALRKLNELPGVEYLDVLFVSFDEIEQEVVQS